MDPSSSPPRHDNASFIVDIEKGPDSSAGLSTPASTFGSPASRSSPKPAASPPPLAAAAGPIAGLQRLFRRNPSTVISGRYTISFRQILLLIMIMMSLVLLWFMATGTAYGLQLSQNQSKPPSSASRIDSKRPAGDSSDTRPGGNPAQDVAPSRVDMAATIKERFERVRGKGSKTSLKKIQYAFAAESNEDRMERERRLEAVKQGFAHAWKGYKENAWGHDEVRPVSGGYRDAFNGWGATMIDSLDTLVIMGFNEEFDEALEWVKTSFDMTKNPTSPLQFFETVIRYLGGFLSAYDLTGEKVLLDKAEELGNYMLNAFQNNVMPNGRVAVQKNANSPSYSFVLAEVGTIQLEFTRLSQLTNNPIYDEKAQKIFQVLGTATSELPGLLPSYVQDGNGQHFSNFKATVGGMVDSYYEYLLKEWILLDGDAPQYRTMFETAANSMEQHMVLRPENGSEDYALFGQVHSNSKTVEADMEHLACFIAGSLAMGSKYFDRPKDMILAKQVAQSCYLSYHHSETGIGPEAMKFDRGQQSHTFVAKPDTFYSRSSSNRVYILRPETLESLWILYRLTGEKKYQDQAWEIFQALEKSCRTKIAYSGLRDVNQPGSHDDKMESFFLAETMKYLYLMFSPPDVISLDDFVLNTEAHPIRRT